MYFRRGALKKPSLFWLQGGPLPFINGVITPINTVIIPQLLILKASYRGYNSIYNDRRGSTLYPIHSSPAFDGHGHFRLTQKVMFFFELGFYGDLSP